MAESSQGAASTNVDAPPIEVSNLTKIYTTRRGPLEAVRNVSFATAPGEFTALVGPSGCGKSTILKIAAGLIPYEAGTVKVGGEAAAPGRKDVGIMFQAPVLFPWRTVMANVLLPVQVFRMDRREADKRAKDLLELVGLADVPDKYPFELSGGMQQRVSLARLLVTNPTYMFMDEPFAALDEFNRARLNQELASIHERFKRTVLYVTHNISEAVLMADRVVVLKSDPGEILDIVDINLPRPRQLDVLDSDRAQEFVVSISRTLREASQSQRTE